MNKIAIYTAIFNGKDQLQEPEFIPPNCDFICFTDAVVSSSVWESRPGEMFENDPVRSARRHKILAHQFLADYEYSIWVDGNIVVRGDVNKLIERYLGQVNMAVYDHQYTALDPRHCLYDEAEVLVELAGTAKYKDDPGRIKRQIDRYRAEGYPAQAGLLSSMELVRRHLAPDVKTAMEAWWQEVRTESRRDQLSFNYVAWKHHFKFTYIPEDSRDNEFFRQVKHQDRHYFDSPKRML